VASESHTSVWKYLNETIFVRAKNVSPSKAGDSYGYTVDKYWIVKEVLPEGSLLVQTTRGKELTLPADDMALRKPYIWERIKAKHRARLATANCQFQSFHLRFFVVALFARP